MSAPRSAWPWLLGGLALAASNFWLVAYDVNQIDEAWTLQVTRRILDGDALYGDVWFGVTPLSIYVLAGLAAAVGTHVLLVKVAVALLAAGAALLVALIARQAGLSGFAAALLALLTIPLAPAAPVSLYTPLAVLLLLACESTALLAVARSAAPRTALVAGAGALAGASFAAKQNVGGLALAALVATVMVSEPTRSGLRRAGLAVATFTGVALAAVATMVATGGVSNTLDALGLGKREYLAYGSIHYHDALRDHVTPALRVQTWIDQLAGRDRDLVVATPKALLPVVTGLLLAAAWVAWSRRRERRLPDARLTTVTSFALAGFLAAFPRYDTIHLAWTAGPLLVACAVALAVLLREPGRALRAAAAALAAAWTAFVLAGPLEDWRADPVRMGLPHFEGTWTSEETLAQAVAWTRALEDAVPRGSVFLVLPSASFYYLAAGLENPTRYDFSSRDVIGQREIEDVVRGLRTGRVPTVCLANAHVRDAETWPAELERALRRELRPGADLGPCRLWHAPGEP